MTTALTIQSLTGFDGPTWAATLNSKSSSGTSYRKRKKTLSSAAAASAAYGIDAMAANIVPLAASGTSTLDLTSIVDVFGQTLTFATIKFVFLLNMATEDDATLIPGASAINVGAAATPHALFMSGATDTINLLTGEPLNWWTPKAAGRTVDSTHKLVLLTNADATNAGKLMYLFAGAKG